VQLLGAAVGNCLTDSLLFALRKFHQEPRGLTTEVETIVGRNAEGRLRVTQLRVAVRLGVAASELEHLERALTQFERFCTVAQSVAQGIPVEVTVWDSMGAKLK
jgi:organic hydroperoxide reductase OsmC/OhrA